MPHLRIETAPPTETEKAMRARKNRNNRGSKSEQHL